jgi:hypothetical protein
MQQKGSIFASPHAMTGGPPISENYFWWTRQSTGFQTSMEILEENRKKNFRYLIPKISLILSSELQHGLETGVGFSLRCNDDPVFP